MSQVVSWGGTKEQLQELATAVGHNCTCSRSALAGGTPSTCAAHRMMRQDQRALNGLLFERHIAERLRREEFADALESAGPEPARHAPPAPGVACAGRAPHRLRRLAGLLLAALGIGHRQVAERESLQV
jgi:hypothetical protein